MPCELQMLQASKTWLYTQTSSLPSTDNRQLYYKSMLVSLTSYEPTTHFSN